MWFAIHFLVLFLLGHDGLWLNPSRELLSSKFEATQDPRGWLRFRLAAGQQQTDERGNATLEVPAGVVDVETPTHRIRFENCSRECDAGQTTQLRIELAEESVAEEEIVVTATRANTRIEDEPLRSSVVDQEEVDEKAVMTPGDIAMLLNETSGHPRPGNVSVARCRKRSHPGLRGRYSNCRRWPSLYGRPVHSAFCRFSSRPRTRLRSSKASLRALWGVRHRGVINCIERPAASQTEACKTWTSARIRHRLLAHEQKPKDGSGSYTLLGVLTSSNRFGTSPTETAYADHPDIQPTRACTGEPSQCFWENVENGKYPCSLTAGD
jgi:hypothetical protein